MRVIAGEPGDGGASVSCARWVGGWVGGGWGLKVDVSNATFRHGVTATPQLFPGPTRPEPPPQSPAPPVAAELSLSQSYHCLAEHEPVIPAWCRRLSVGRCTMKHQHFATEPELCLDGLEATLPSAVSTSGRLWAACRPVLSHNRLNGVLASASAAAAGGAGAEAREGVQEPAELRAVLW